MAGFGWAVAAVIAENPHINLIYCSKIMILMAKQMIFGAFGVAGLVALCTLLDLIMGFPFAGSVTLDILFLVSSAIVGYLAWDAFRDLA